MGGQPGRGHRRPRCRVVHTRARRADPPRTPPPTAARGSAGAARPAPPPRRRWPIRLAVMNSLDLRHVGQVGELPGAVLHRERGHDRADPDDGQERDDDLDRVRQLDADHVAGPDALGQQHLRQPGDLLVELRPGQRAERPVQQRLPVQRVDDRRDVAVLPRRARAAARRSCRRSSSPCRGTPGPAPPDEVPPFLPGPIGALSDRSGVATAPARVRVARPGHQRHLVHARAGVFGQPGPDRPLVAGQRDVADQLRRDGGQQLAADAARVRAKRTTSSNPASANISPYPGADR